MGKFGCCRGQANAQKETSMQDNIAVVDSFSNGSERKVNQHTCYNASAFRSPATFPPPTYISPLCYPTVSIQ
ncbi:hypothetical protein WAI453_003008 [Rhynchosporium graminicola]